MQRISDRVDAVVQVLELSGAFRPRLQDTVEIL
jgi:hypothetical protein